VKKRLTFESWLEESDTWRETARGLIGEDDLYGERTRPRDPDESAVLRRLGLDRVQPFSAIDGSAHPASQIRRMRNRRGLSQSDLAERLGVSQQQVQQLEDPRRSNPTWRTMCKIARALDSYWDLDLLPTA
jgi:DNA-binding XRE family transcriptional regulator